jgi:peptidoglycan hydrolase-like protein with peptidoglycan-binding domain
MVPHICGQRSGRRPVVVAIVASLLLLLLAPNAAVAAVPTWLDRQAGWHGRAIERPLERSDAARSAADSGSTVLTVSAGDGFGTAAGSATVRSVQRMLRQLGYAVGAVDGRFGPRTRSAVGWFQRKHGLSIDGIAGPQTLERLRARAGDGSATTNVEAAPRESAPPAPDEDTQAARPAAPDDTRAAQPGTSDTAEAAKPSDRWLVAAIAVAAILVAILLGLLLRRNRRPTEGTVVSLARPLWVAGVSPDPTVGPFAGSAAALHVSPPSGADDEPAIRYCVIDEARGTPVWVSPQDIRESRDLDERQRRQAASALAGHPAAARGGRFARPGTRSRRAGGLARRRPAPASHLQRRVTWFRSLGMPPEAIADLLAEEQIPPPPGHDTWTAAAVWQVDGEREHQAPAVVGRPAHKDGPDDAEGRGT